MWGFVMKIRIALSVFTIIMSLLSPICAMKAPAGDAESKSESKSAAAAAAAPSDSGKGKRKAVDQGDEEKPAKRSDRGEESGTGSEDDSDGPEEDDDNSPEAEIARLHGVIDDKLPEIDNIIACIGIANGRLNYGENPEDCLAALRALAEDKKLETIVGKALSIYFANRALDGDGELLWREDLREIHDDIRQAIIKNFEKYKGILSGLLRECRNSKNLSTSHELIFFKFYKKPDELRAGIRHGGDALNKKDVREVRSGYYFLEGSYLDEERDIFTCEDLVYHKVWDIKRNYLYNKNADGRFEIGNQPLLANLDGLFEVLLSCDRRGHTYPKISGKALMEALEYQVGSKAFVESKKVFGSAAASIARCSGFYKKSTIKRLIITNTGLFRLDSKEDFKAPLGAREQYPLDCFEELEHIDLRNNKIAILDIAWFDGLRTNDEDEKTATITQCFIDLRGNPLFPYKGKKDQDGKMVYDPFNDNVIKIVQLRTKHVWLTIFVDIPNEGECCVCFSEYSPERTRTFLQCGHEICAECIRTTRAAPAVRSACPTCRKPIVEFNPAEDLRNVPRARPVPAAAAARAAVVAAAVARRLAAVAPAAPPAGAAAAPAPRRPAAANDDD